MRVFFILTALAIICLHKTVEAAAPNYDERELYEPAVELQFKICFSMKLAVANLDTVTEFKSVSCPGA
ncbi:unnamed protein product [Echinostoma caproni]|uniref:Secreted protein n=1 Tax=Echinostoma caproni TaxID=27848 RepID=A0A183AWL5_9TREM|nr:unnamed protein product [Echinostoma caproni]